jgi:hypothetical protein
MFSKSVRFLISLLFVFVFLTTSIPSNLIFAQKEKVQNRLLLTSIELNHATPDIRKMSIQINFNQADLSFKSTEQGLLLMLAGCEHLNIPDQPALPCIRKEIQVGPNEVITGIKTIQADSFSLPLPKAGIKFAEPARRISEPGLEVKKNLIMPEFFPTNNFDYVLTENQCTKTLSLLVNPVYIDHNKLIFVTHMEIQITLGSAMTTKSIKSADAKPYSIILAPDDLAESAKKLQSIQEKDGYEASVKLISEFQSYDESPKPVIDGVVGFLDASADLRARVAAYDNSLARKIQKWLKELTDQQKVQYLTIMGDGTYVPPSYYVFSTDNMDSYDRWVPTDIFYNSPDASGKNFPILISVGRLPVRDKDEAAQVVDKIEKYRKNLDPSWFKNADIMAGDPFSGDYFGELSTTKAINANFLEGLNITRYYKTEGKFSTEPFMKAMKENKHGFVWGFGHGGGDGLALEPGYITSKNIMDLPEKAELPIFLSEACGNGAFDTRLANAGFGTNSQLKYPTSFSESILLSKGGGIAYIGGARVNYAGWNMIYEKGIPNLLRVYYEDAILEYFMECYHNKAGALGDITRQTLETYAKRDWFGINAPLIKTFFGFTLQGDPTIKIPFFENPGKREIPSIKPDETKPTDVSDIPLFSIDDGTKLEVKSNSASLYYILCDYNNPGKPVKEQGNFENPTAESYTKDFKDFSKTKMTIRVGTDDGKENRVVFYGRYNHDLVIQKPYDLQLLQKNEKKAFWVKIYNDGIFEEDNVQVTVKDNTQVLTDTTFPTIPILSSRYVYYTFTSDTAGAHPLTIQTPALTGESAISDNQINNNLQVSAGKIFRIGVLDDSPQLDRSYYESRLMLSQINKKFQDLALDMEICVVPLGRDENGKTTIDRLNLDAIILYSTDYYTYPMRDLVTELEKFESQGGIVFGFLSLGQNSYGIDLVDIQSYFGISATEKFQLWRTDEKTKTFQILDSFSEMFPKSSYEITSRYALLPKGKDWNGIELEGGELVGTDKDNQYALIKNKNRYLFTGFLADKDFNKADQSLEFFIDLLLQVKKMPVDLVVDHLTMDPPVGIKNHSSDCTVVVRNNGLVDVENVSVVLNLNRSETIPYIPAKGTAKAAFNMDWKGISGNQGLQIEINPKKETKESDYTNNLYKTAYFVAAQGEPDEAPVIEFTEMDKKTVQQSSYLIQGKATPDSIILMDMQQIAQNSDGSFQKIVTLQPGRNKFLFTIRKGSLYGQEMIYEVTYSPFSKLLLKVGEARAVLDVKLVTLDNAPFIKAGSTFVPLRFISDAFKAKTNFIAKPNQEIQIEYNGSTIFLWINKTNAKIKSADGNSKDIKLSAPPVIVKGRTFVPLRFIAEAFGANVLWKADTESIEIQIPQTIKTDTTVNLFSREEEPNDPGIIATSKKEGMVINPSCIDKLGDSTFVSMYDGIYEYGPENQVKTYIPWDPAFVEAITEKGLRGISSTPNRGFFRMTDTRILISDFQNIYVLENPSGRYLYRINGTEYKNYAEPLSRFGFIQDMEVSNNQLYVLDPYQGISVIDLTTGELTGIYYVDQYPWDMTLYDGKIYVCLLYGGIISMNIDGSHMQTFYFEGDMYCNTLSVNEKGVFYLNTYFPENTIYRFTMQDSFKMLETISLSGSVGNFVERMVSQGDQYYAITYSERTIGTFSVDSKFIQCDENYKLTSDFGKEDTKKVSKAGNFITNPGQVWVTESTDFLVSMNFPSNQNMVRYYDGQGTWIRDIKINPDDPDAQILDVTYSGNQTLSVLYQKKTYFVQNFHFTKDEAKVTSDVVALKMKYGQLLPSSYAIGNGFIAVGDYITGNIILFDAVSGLEKDRFSLEGSENYTSNSAVSKMILANDKLYILDQKQPFINVYALKDHLLETQIQLPSFDLPILYDRFDFQVISENSLSVLDKSLSRIYQITNGVVMDVWGDKMIIPPHIKDINLNYNFWNPTSFDFRNGTFIINDLGNQRIVFGKYPREILAPLPAIQTSMEKVEQIMYQNKPVSLELGVQILFSPEPFTAEVPDFISVGDYDGKARATVLNLTILTNRLAQGTSRDGVITIVCMGIKKEIPIHVERKLNQIKFLSGSSIILSNVDPIISKNPVLIEKNVLLVPVTMLPELFEMLINVQKNKVTVTSGSLMIDIDTITSKAQLITSIGKSPLDLKGKVKIQKGVIYIPMNGIFDLLSKKAVIKDSTGLVEF